MSAFFVGIDVGGTNIKIMVMTSDLNVLDWCVIPTQKDLGYEKISDNIIHAIEKIFINHGVKDPEVKSIGMGLPGIVDKHANKTVHLAYMAWNGFNPCEKIGAHFNAPSYIDNDGSLNAFGEYKFGVHEKFSNIVLLTLGTGVGCGVVVDGKIFRGSRNLGAELGHMQVEVEGAENCVHCGHPGCLEAYCSGLAMEKYALRQMPNFPTSILHQFVDQNRGVYDNAMITKGVHVGDDLCCQVMARFIKYLSVGVANVMKLFNPELILIGGGISNAGDVLLKPLAGLVQDLVLHERQLCPVEKAILGPHAGMYGACAFAADSIT